MKSKIKAGEFCHSKNFRAVAKVIEIERLWGHDYVRIWLPNPDTLVRVPVADRKHSGGTLKFRKIFKKT